MTVDLASVVIYSVKLVSLDTGVGTLSDAILHLVVNYPIPLGINQESCFVTTTTEISLSRNDLEKAIFSELS